MISKKEALILELMEPITREWFGFDIADRSNGKISRGVAHVYLSRLVDKGFVTYRKEDNPTGKYVRNLYRLTLDGLRAKNNYTTPKPKGRWILNWQ